MRQHFEIVEEFRLDIWIVAGHWLQSVIHPSNMTTNLIWCNDTTLKFIGLYEAESVIWNPNHAQYKDKIAAAEAWDRIANIMGAQVPDLKRKKETLMTSYRLMKKRQLKQGDEFVTSWYAFRSMDNFLGHLYEKYKDGESNGDCSLTKTVNKLYCHKDGLH